MKLCALASLIPRPLPLHAAYTFLYSDPFTCRTKFKLRINNNSSYISVYF